MSDLNELLRKSTEAVKTMTLAEREEMYKQQRESWVRAEMGWPKPKYKWINGVKVYDSIKDYYND